jgi:hypothetical protein
MPNTMILVLIVLVLVAAGALPYWPHSAAWGGGWGPSGMFGAILLVLLVFYLLGAR